MDLTAEDNFFVERLMPPARRVPNCCAPPGSPAPSAPEDWHSPGRHAAAPPPRSSPPARPQRPRVQPPRRDRRACGRRSGFRSAAARVPGVIAFFTTEPREPAPVLWPRWPRWTRLGAPSPVGSQAPRFPPTRLARWTRRARAALLDGSVALRRHDRPPPSDRRGNRRLALCATSGSAGVAASDTRWHGRHQSAETAQVVEMKHSPPWSPNRRPRRVWLLMRLRRKGSLPSASPATSTQQSRPAMGVAVLRDDDELIHPPLPVCPKRTGLS